VDDADNLVAAQRGDDALDLTPVAEARDIAVVAAPLRPRRRLVAGVVAITRDQIGSVVERRAAVDEGRNHDGRHTPAPVSRLRTIAVNEALTMLLTVVRLASAAGLCQGPAMTTRNTRAGGCFLTVCILAGFPLGLAIKNPMKGILIGTGVGAALAVLLWLIDRRKGA
jgi:hypothetical protein